MSGETRRSGRANKGVHTKASSSPGPPNPNKPAGAVTKGKGKKSTKAQPTEESGEDDAIRCICGDENPNDKRAFIGCDACSVWQHNVCMGEAEDDEEVPEHYFCEDCRPEEHRETIVALAEGRRIWDERTTQWKQWKKMSASRRKSKGKGEEARPSWLKKDVPNADEDMDEDVPEVEVEAEAPEEVQEVGAKRKRESVKPEPELVPAEVTPEVAARAAPQTRPDKRRKSSQPAGKVASDSDTAIVSIDQLPADRKRVAEALSKVVADDITTRVADGFSIPDGQTAKSLGEHYAGLIEYSLIMNYNETTAELYKSQFRALMANLKQNKVLIERLLGGSLKPNALATMPTKDMASEEQQRRFAELKEELDRQVVKGEELIETVVHRDVEFPSYAAPVRERASVADEGAGSPANGQSGARSPVKSDPATVTVDTTRPANLGLDRRTSSQQFDMNSIWSKTAQSPTTGPRPMQMPPRRRSSITQLPNAQQDGAKDDEDVDRLLQDPYEEVTRDDTVVWRGKLVHSGEGEPEVNARFVAGRNLTDTVSWRELLPERLNIDGRLQIAKAEEYLCGLEWSNTSDISVLAFSPYDDADAFKAVFEYFQTRARYAVVNKDKPKMVKDLYVIPVEVGGPLPDHMTRLAYCGIKLPIEQRLLLATFVVARSPDKPQIASDSTLGQQPPSANGQHHLPQHMRGVPGPAGSPLSTNAPTFSPSQQHASPTAGYGGPLMAPNQSPFPPNPYNAPALSGFGEQTATPSYPPSTMPSAMPALSMQPHSNPLVAEILGTYQWAPSAIAILSHEPKMGREKLENLRRIFETDVAARTDLEALGRKLMGGQ
ncbi:hypothetical protein LTR08_003762 [Meristemomyces frigidus]|nr:hypothetical protein LTR08_003762 [Meristemomyces frigidus]